VQETVLALMKKAHSQFHSVHSGLILQEDHKMANKDGNNLSASPKHPDQDNLKQQQSRQSQERKSSGQSGSSSGRNNYSPRKGDKGEQHSDGMRNSGH
jgi:hypothetical protein